MAILERPETVEATRYGGRPRVVGKFLWAGDRKVLVRGVTYGTFRAGPDGSEYGCRERVDADFGQMVASGITAIRTYTVPPRWLLDSAARHGLWVMVGLPWEQHITFLDDRDRVQDIERRVRMGVEACAGHPAILCYAIGNEIPASIVRWHGARRIERFLERLYRIAKEADPEGLVTYVNYPTTEYLDLSFVDVLCFNVYLEAEERLAAYLARLQTMAGNRPLLMAEIGLDSRQNGVDVQAQVLDWQIRTVFGAGCAGIFVFSWTDEWVRGGEEITEWDFGLVDRQRRPKPALERVRQAWEAVPFGDDLVWPRITVVVCSHNGARTIEDTCRGLAELDYPNHDVIVVDDGSTDGTAAIARSYGFRVISTPNRGLSAARNVGLAAATGEIVAYTDDDARPDPDWLRYLGAAFLRSEHAGIGGPNIAPPDDGMIAQCVASAPGGPVHVLLTDEVAEHIPGCNMAIRKEALDAVGGFDERYRVAGDDVDMCWRLQERGWTIGFSPAAMVWHHRRNSVRAYWKQQKGYGTAEALLEEKWPEKYNPAGHLSWSGRLYGPGAILPLAPTRRIYHGVYGSAPFQRLYTSDPGLFSSLMLMPEWYLVIALLAGLSALGLIWPSQAWVLPLLLVAFAPPLLHAVHGARRATLPEVSSSRALRMRALIAGLYLLQPAVRLWGRLTHGLTPWRFRGRRSLALPIPVIRSIWSEEWRSPEAWISGLRAELGRQGALSWPGPPCDPWDLEVRNGMLASVRVTFAVEDHAGGRQMVRYRIRPHLHAAMAWILLVLTGMAVGEVVVGAWAITLGLAVVAIVCVGRAVYDLAAAAGACLHAIQDVGKP